MEKKFMMYIIIGIVLVGAIYFLTSSHTFYSILPAGQNNHNTDCTFVTNALAASGTWSIEDYERVGSEGKWVSLDINGDGTKEVFGYDGSGNIPGSTYCDLVGGDYITLTALGNFRIRKVSGSIIYLCDGPKAKAYSSASATINPYTTCGSCTPSCSTCGGSNGCGGTCQTGSCPSGQTCSSGVCVGGTSGTCLITDTNNNGKVDRDELGVAISRWVQNQ